MMAKFNFWDRWFVIPPAALLARLGGVSTKTLAC